MGTKQGRADLWKSVKEKVEAMALWISQHPLKAVFWLVIGAGASAGIHFLAPVILGGILGITSSSAVAGSVLGVRLAAWFSGARV